MNLGPKGGVDLFRKRREKLLSQLKGVAILPSAQEYIRNNDVHFPFRQDSSFYYLTGFTEPESVIVLDPSSPSPFTLFVREKDPTRELWDGFRYGTEGALKHFGPNKVYPISEFESRLPELIKSTDQVYYKLGENKEFDKIMLDSFEKARRLKGRSGLGYASLIDVKQLIGEMRLFKSSDEIELMKKACEISAQGHLAALRVTKPGMFEYQIEAEVEREFRRLGADRVGYGSIVGSGANATVLHYVSNTDECKKEDLLLIDAGAEYGYVSGDITRTFPVSGKFSPAQKKFYETVLKVQKDCVAFVKPGVTMPAIHARAIEGLTEGMLELGILKGNKKELIEKREFYKYYPHGTGHWLGMDVHDAGLYAIHGEPRKLEPGICFTVEPGLYIPASDQNVPAEYRGMGVRIEDDVIVTAKGCDNLTSTAPKDIDAIEAAMN